MSRIERDGTRRRTRLFSGFLSHYLIGDRYGRPGKGNDKGAVEGLVRARRSRLPRRPRVTEGARTARVVARAALSDRKRAWALYRLAEARGLVDLLLAGSAAPDGSPQEFLHLLLCADLSRRSEEFGCTPTRFRSATSSHPPSASVSKTASTDRGESPLWRNPVNLVTWW